MVPFNSFSGDIWFALDGSRPLARFAGIWTNWTSVWKVNKGETTNDRCALGSPFMLFQAYWIWPGSRGGSLMRKLTAISVFSCGSPGPGPSCSPTSLPAGRSALL